MSTTPAELMQLSESLCQSSSCEATLRASIGRAYYAAYHAAIKFHNSLDMPGAEPPNRRGVHATLIYQLENPRITDRDSRRASKTHSYLLKTIRTARVEADYDLECDISLPVVETQIENAKRLIGLSAIQTVPAESC